MKYNVKRTEEFKNYRSTLKEFCYLRTDDEFNETKEFIEETIVPRMLNLAMPYNREGNPIDGGLEYRKQMDFYEVLTKAMKMRMSTIKSRNVAISADHVYYICCDALSAVVPTKKFKSNFPSELFEKLSYFGEGVSTRTRHR
ncbi:MAG: hypothetical protein GXO64_01145 [Candidatus Micrarchaeota archaeon]|nr:hypothetical protein [Candidatus Micrarchaeota archaeon]